MFFCRNFFGVFVVYVFCFCVMFVWVKCGFCCDHGDFEWFFGSYRCMFRIVFVGQPTKGLRFLNHFKDAESLLCFRCLD